jgi:hypothetical protein
MLKICYTVLPIVFIASASAQLSPEQKASDFLNLAGIYAKGYAPYEWKRDVFNFDLLNIQPWLDQAAKTADDLDFYDLCIRYVAGLKSGGHDRFLIPSTFSARLNFTVDLYDGKTLIDSINRAALPESSFPFQIGDELVSVDGKTSEQLITELAPYGIVSSPGAQRRSAAGTITTRTQQRIARLIDLGDTATVVIRREGGALETYTIRWTKTGTPLIQVGPVPDPGSAADKARLAGVPLADPDEPEYMAVLRALQNATAYGTDTVLGSGAIAPIFTMPPEWSQRLGNSPLDEFFSGTFPAGGYTIGFIRIPSFSPRSQTRALQQFNTEIAYFQANTDGLIVDDMRNPGGSVAYLNLLAQRLIPYPFRTLGYEIRATSNWIESLSSSVRFARLSGADQSIIDLLQQTLDSVVAANAQNRGRTGPVPVDGPTLERQPATDAQGNMIAYTKPLMVLVDEFAGSGGDAFPATIQDNGRGPIFGMRTMGLGGTVSNVNATAYSEAITRITQSLMNRKAPVITPDLPAAPYVENIGVRPDIVVDYMTRDNLLYGGNAFVARFMDAMVNQIRASQ